MARGILIGGVAALCFIATIGASPLAAMGPVSIVSPLGGTPTPVSFWSRPYPYGFTGWGPCIRYVPVGTAEAVYWRRINICGNRPVRYRAVRS